MLVPQELVDWIIEFLHNDTAALCACSLVSRNWLPSSSFHLFSCLRWPPCMQHQWAEESRGQAQVPCKCHMIANSETLAVVEALLSETARIAHNVKDLRIKMIYSMPRGGPDGVRLQYFHRTTSPSELMRILGLASRVAKLEIESLQLVAEPPHAAPSLARGVPRSLHTFHLASPVVPNGAHTSLLDILSHFRSISTFAFWGVFLPLDCMPPLPSPPAQRPSLSSLRIWFYESQYGGGWLDLLHAHLDMTMLTSLTIKDSGLQLPGTDDPGTTPALHRILRECKNLRSLTCVDSVFDGLLHYPTPCPTLREFQSSNRRALTPVFCTWAEWESFVAALSCPLMSTVQEATLALTITRFTDLDGVSDARTLESVFGDMLKTWGWQSLDAAGGRLQAFTLDLKLRREEYAQWNINGGMPVSANRDLVWDKDRCGAILADVMRDRLPALASRRVLHSRVTVLPDDRGACSC